MPLRKRIAEIRERVERESEAILSEEEMKQFNEELQMWRESLPEDSFLVRITPLKYGAVMLDLYLRISLIAELITRIIEDGGSEIKQDKIEIDKKSKLIKGFKK